MTQFSLTQIQTVEAINDLIEQLEGVAGELKSALRQTQLLRAHVSTVPRPAPGDEGSRPAVIAPDHRTGEDAFFKALEALTDWYGDPDLSTKAVARHPGAVALLCDSQTEAQILDLVDQGNDLKDQIKNLYPGLGTKGQAFEILHNYHHMLVYLQLVRHWTALPRDPLIQSVTFTWGFKTEIKKLDAATAVKQVGEMKKAAPPQGIEPDDWAALIDANIKKLLSLPGNTVLHRRRPLVVRPMANVRYALTAEEREARRAAWQQNKPYKEKVKLREAHTPLLVLNPNPNIKLGVIGNFDEMQRMQRKKRGGRKAASNPVPGFVDLYQVQTD